MIVSTNHTLLMACIALALGMLAVKHTKFLRNNHIPEAVVGGFIVATILFFINKLTDYTFKFDTSLQSLLMITFFSSIGLSSDFSKLLKGGKPLLILIFIVTILIITQNIVGVGMALLMSEDPFMGLIAGSITLSGGHGNAGAWGPILEQKYGVTGALELAMACATLGLVIGGLMGGPIARHLIKKVKVPDANQEETNTNQESVKTSNVLTEINTKNIIETVFMLSICIVVGSYVGDLLKDTAFYLPTFVWCLFVGIFLRNILNFVFKKPVNDKSIDVLGSTALSIYLAIALMSLNFSQLANMAGPVLLIIIVQTVVMALFACFITFKLMGKDYDAVVISAGHCGFGMGATPTAIANMQTVTKTFGPSHKAFLIVPMVGGFIIDISNSIFIKFFISIIEKIT
jgi:glutamate:Na+ symporter, ESS family